MKRLLWCAIVIVLAIAATAIFASIKPGTPDFPTEKPHVVASAPSTPISYPAYATPLLNHEVADATPVKKEEKPEGQPPAVKPIRPTPEPTPVPIPIPTPVVPDITKNPAVPVNHDVPSQNTRDKKSTFDAASIKAAEAKSRATLAKSEYDKASREADAAEAYAAKAEAEYKISVAKDASDRAESARVAAEKATNDARSADNLRREAEKQAAEAAQRANMQGPPVNPITNPVPNRPVGPAPPPYAAPPPPISSNPPRKAETIKSTGPPEPATITVKVPQRAKVSINGSVTKQTGIERTFVTPELDYGKVYKYVIKVSIDGDENNDVERTLQVYAGQVIVEDFTK